MLRESSGSTSVAAIGMRGSQLPHGAIHCTGIYVVIAKAVWPKKTAEHWAAAAGKQPRMAKYWLSSGNVSDAGKLAIYKLLD